MLSLLLRRSSTSKFVRCLTSNAAAPTEQKIIEQLRVKFPKATDIAVADVSGGCGAMFEVYVEAPDFKNLRKGNDPNPLPPFRFPPA